MKRGKLSIVALLLLFSVAVSMFSITASAEEKQIMPRLDNAIDIYTQFNIVNGNAVASISYNGYEGIFTEAHVYVKLEKRNLLVFWKDVTEWETVSYNSTDSIEFTYPVDSGKYRATIRVEIFGTNGTSDVVENELKADC